MFLILFPFTGKSSCCDALRSCARPSLGRSLYALLVKDLLKFQRNPLYVHWKKGSTFAIMFFYFSMLFMHFFVPILQIAMFCLCVGRKLTDVPMGFISREAVRSSSTSGLILEKIDRNVINLVI